MDRSICGMSAAALMLAGAGTTGTALASVFRAAPTGANEVPAGDPDGAGTASVREEKLAKLPPAEHGPEKLPDDPGP